MHSLSHHQPIELWTGKIWLVMELGAVATIVGLGVFVAARWLV